MILCIAHSGAISVCLTDGTVVREAGFVLIWKSNRNCGLGYNSGLKLEIFALFKVDIKIN